MIFHSREALTVEEHPYQAKQAHKCGMFDTKTEQQSCLLGIALSCRKHLDHLPANV